MADDKKSLLEEIKKMLKAIADYFAQNFGHGAIAQRMKELEDKIDDIADELDDDEVENLYGLVSEFTDGKIQTVENKAQAQEMINTLNANVSNIVDRLVKADDKAITDSLVEALCVFENEGAVTEQAKEEFAATARFISNSNPEDKTICCKHGDKVYRINYEINKLDNEGSPDTPHRFMLKFEKTKILSKEEQDKIFNKDGTVKDGYSYVDKKDDGQGSVGTEISRVVCEKHGYIYTQDNNESTETLKEALQDKYDRKGLYIKSYMNRLIGSDEERYSSIYSSDDFAFKIRDNQTGELIKIKERQNSLSFYLYKNTKDLNPKGDGVYLGAWENSEGGGILGRLAAFKGSRTVSAMMKSAEVQRYLDASGVDVWKQERLFEGEPVPWNKVRQDQLWRVAQFQKSCQKTFRELKKDYVLVINDSPSSKYTFLEAQTKKGDKLSFTFTEDGKPTSIRFLKAGEKKSKFIYDLARKSLSVNYGECKKDEEFDELYAALDEAYIRYEQTEKLSSINRSERKSEKREQRTER